MLAQISTICPSQTYPEPCLILFKPRPLNERMSAIALKSIGLSNACPSSAQQSCEHKDFSAAQFIRFLKHIKLKELLSKITDSRQKKKIKYSSDIILQWALSVYFFRKESSNSLQTTLEKLMVHERAAILNYLGIEEKNGSLPHRTVVNDYLTLVNADEVNDLLIHLFKCT